MASTLAAGSYSNRMYLLSNCIEAASVCCPLLTGNICTSWITPSIFQNLDNQRDGIIDEYTLTQQLGPDAALEVLRPHWDSWASLSDFQRIASAGFNTVRIPSEWCLFMAPDNGTNFDNSWILGFSKIRE